VLFGNSKYRPRYAPPPSRSIAAVQCRICLGWAAVWNAVLLFNREFMIRTYQELLIHAVSCMIHAWYVLIKNSNSLLRISSTIYRGTYFLMVVTIGLSNKWVLAFLDFGQNCSKICRATHILSATKVGTPYIAQKS